MKIFTGIRLIVTLLAMWVAVIPGIASHAQHADDTAITIGLTDFPTTLDPGQAYDFTAWEVLSHLYTGLTRQIPGTFEYELALARTVQISNDRLTYTFTLYDDLTFADGTPITAQTFVASLERTRALREGATQAIEPYVASVTATESGQLVFTLTRPVPYFLALLALPPYFPQHPDLLANPQPEPFTKTLIGNGPYQLERFAPGERIVLRANPAYQHGAPPATDTIILRSFSRSQDLRDALRTHAIDLAWRALYSDHLTQLSTESDDWQIITTPSTRVFYLLFNQSRPPFADPALRTAITALIERAPIAAALDQHITPLTSLIPAVFTDAYAPLWPDTPALDTAESTLQAAGYRTRGSQQLLFTIGYSRSTYGLLHAAGLEELIWRDLNLSDYITAELDPDIDTATLISALERGDYSQDALVFAWTPLAPHPAAYLRPLAHSEAALPRNNHYATAPITAGLDQAALLDDPAEQGALYQLIAEQLLATHALIPLWQDQLAVVAWNDISGIQIEGNFFLHYDLLTRR